MSKLVTIFGGSGFLGRYVARRLAKEGWRVRVAVRDPNLAGFVRMYGHVGQVLPIPCNIRDDDSVRAALAGADAAVNCVGTFDRKGRNSIQWPGFTFEYRRRASTFDPADYRLEAAA